MQLRLGVAQRLSLLFKRSLAAISFMGATDSKATLYAVALLILLMPPMIIHIKNKYINSKSWYNQELRSIEHSTGV